MKKTLLVAGIIGVGVATTQTNAQSVKDMDYIYDNITKIEVSDAEAFIETLAEKIPRLEDWNNNKQKKEYAFSDNKSIFDFIEDDKINEKYGAIFNNKRNELLFIEVAKHSHVMKKPHYIQVSVFDGRTGWLKRGYFDKSIDNSKNHLKKSSEKEKSEDMFLIGDYRYGAKAIPLTSQIKDKTMKSLNAAYSEDIQYIISVLENRNVSKRKSKTKTMNPNLNIIYHLPKKYR